MAKLIKKVKLREARQIAAKYEFMTALACLVVFSNPLSNTTLDSFSSFMAYFVVILLSAFAIFVLYYALAPSEGINDIFIYEDRIEFIVYDKQKRKETYIFNNSDINAFNLNIKYNRDYSIIQSQTLQKIIINIEIECFNRDKVNISFDTYDSLKIKKIFSIAKYIPNFSYNVETNSEGFNCDIKKYAQTGKGITLYERLKIYLADKNVPDDTKIFIKIMIILFVIYIIIFTPILIRCLTN